MSSFHGSPSTRSTTAEAELDARQKRYLKTLCHNLKPSVRTGGKGITDSLLRELSQTLDHHELVKIKLTGTDQEQVRSQIQALLEHSHATLIQHIGHTACLFRRNAEAPKIALPGQSTY